MKDRVPGTGGYSSVTGARRYASYASLSDETPTEYLYLAIADNATETGTALSKSNLMTDDTASKLCLTDAGTIDNALNKIGIYTDVTVSSGWTQGTLSSQTVYYKDLTVSGVTTSSKPFLHAMLPSSSTLTKANVKASRKQAAKVIGFDVVEAGKIRLYAYEDITIALVARFTNI